MKDKTHRLFINQLPCVSCNKNPPSECSHIRRNTNCGTGIKPSDVYTLPNCRKCHSKVDFIITRDNSDKFKELALQLYEASGDVIQGIKLVKRFYRNERLHN